jgi:hypothetical protein
MRVGVLARKSIYAIIGGILAVLLTAQAAQAYSTTSPVFVKSSSTEYANFQYYGDVFRIYDHKYDGRRLQLHYEVWTQKNGGTYLGSWELFGVSGTDTVRDIDVPEDRWVAFYLCRTDGRYGIGIAETCGTTAWAWNGSSMT